MARSSITRYMPAPLKRRVKKVVRAVRRRHSPTAKPPAPAARPPETDRAKVTSVGTNDLLGTLEIPHGAGPVRVTLFVNDLEVDHVDVPPAKGGTSSFRFPIRDIWRFCRPDDQVTVRLGEARLRMPDGALHYSPTTAGKESLSALRARLQAGQIINSAGMLALPKYLDTKWQEAVTGLHQRVHDAVLEISGRETFLIYGSLLGAVREGRPLGHDYDLDTAYLSTHTDPALVTAEAGQIALGLQERGFSVEARVTCIHVSDAKKGQRIDLYHLYFDENDELRLAWGVAGDEPFRRQQWRGTEPIVFAGATVLIPRNAEALVESLYGPHWRTPNPGFNWNRERTDCAPEAYFPVEIRPIINWQHHWMHTTEDAPSSFAQFVTTLPVNPSLIVDLGCGDGRDATKFVREGAAVMGLDKAPAAITSARGRRLMPEVATFVQCDLGKPGALPAVLDSEVEDQSPRLYYARQFLDSVTESVQASFLADLEDLAQPGDAIALEFRGPKDNTLTGHEQWSCGRRTVDPEPIREWLTSAGFVVLADQESDRWERRRSKGIYLHRIVAEKAEADSLSGAARPGTQDAPTA